MSTVFNNPYTQAPVIWSIQDATITWATTGDTGTFKALNQIQVQYQRSVQKYYPLGAKAPIFVYGVPQGTIQLQTLIGPATLLLTFIKAAGNECDPMTITITPSRHTRCASNANVKTSQLTASYCVANTVNMSIQTDQQGMGMATGVIVLDFSALDWTDVTQTLKNTGADIMAKADTNKAYA